MTVAMRAEVVRILREWACIGGASKGEMTGDAEWGIERGVT
jgi:hypothetical protein